MSDSTPFGDGSNFSFELAPYLRFALTVIAIAAVYSLGLNGPLLLDDYSHLYGLMQSGNAGTPLPELISRFGISDSGPLGRPISMFSFAVNASLFGNDVFYWKLINVLLHCLNGVLLYLVLQPLFHRIPRLQHKATSLAFFVSAIWLANPAQLSSVLYTVQRMNLLAAFFTLLCLLCYIRAREQTYITDKVPRYVAAAGCFLLAIFSKENAILTLGYILIIEIYFFDGINQIRARLNSQQIKSLRIALTLTFLSLFALVIFSAASDFSTQQFSIGQRLLSEPRVIIQYIYQWIVPVPSNLPFFYDDMEISKSLFNPLSTLFSIAVLGGMVWWAYRYRQRYVLISAAIAWFLMGHSLESSVFPLPLMFEYRNYIPSIGISIVIVFLFSMLNIKPKSRDVSMIAYLSLLVFLLALRADLWNDESEFYTSTLRYRPHSENLLAAEANLLLTEKKYAEARQLLGTKTTAATLLHTAYVDCISKGKVDSETLTTSMRLTHKPISSYWFSTAINLVKYALSDGCQLPAIDMDTLLAKGAADYAEASQHYWIIYYRAHWARKSQRLDKAYALLDELTENHTNPMPFFLRAEWLLDDQRAAEAIQSLADGKKRAGDDIPLYRETIDNLEKRLTLG